MGGTRNLLKDLVGWATRIKSWYGAHQIRRLYWGVSGTRASVTDRAVNANQPESRQR